MAIDPLASLAEEELPMGQLDAATIKKIVHDVLNPQLARNTTEAQVAIKKLLHTSFLPGLFMISQFADVDEMDTGIEKTMLKIVSQNTHLAFRPPYSKTFIYDWVLTDWLVTCVACDSF
jgi:hypothetical protein